VGPAQHAYGGLVLVQRADGGVDDEQDDVGRTGGDLGLGGDGGGAVARVRRPTTGVHNGEPAARPLRVVGDAVRVTPGTSSTTAWRARARD
jgi:hypothetical protein